MRQHGSDLRFPTWESVSASADNTVFDSLPTSPTGYAFDVCADTAHTQAQGATAQTANWTSLTAANSAFTIINGGLAAGGDITLTGQNYVYETAAAGGASGWYPQTLKISLIGPVNASLTSAGSNVTIEMPLAIWVPGGVTGGVVITDAAPSGSIFSNNTGTVAVVGAGTVNVAVESAPSIAAGSPTPTGMIDVTENAPGALEDSGTAALTFTLPPGFTWGTPTFTYMWGSSLATDGVAAYDEITSPQGTGGYKGGWTNTADNGRELKFYNYVASSSALYFKVSAPVSIDESAAKTGNITVTVGGQTSANVSTLVVGNYGEVRRHLRRLRDRPDHHGRHERLDHRRAEIKEGIPGSLLDGRTITLTLPTNVAWSADPDPGHHPLHQHRERLSAFTALAAEGTNGNQIQCTVGRSAHAHRPDHRPDEPGGLLPEEHGSHPGGRFQRPRDSDHRRQRGPHRHRHPGHRGCRRDRHRGKHADRRDRHGGQTLGNITITEAAAGNLGYRRLPRSRRL